MAETYFNQRADDCVRLADIERDTDLRQMLLDLAASYRTQARLAMLPFRAH